MDSHCFRIVGEELIRFLSGARIEKIHGPALNTFVFQVYAKEQKVRVVFRYGKQDSLLFITNKQLANPLNPKGDVMRLRKYVGGRRLLQGIMHFSQRCIVFPIANAGQPPEHYLVLHVKDGAKIVHALPQEMAAEPCWPPQDIITGLCSKNWDKKETQGPWQQYSLLTPLLRETLAEMEPLDGLALMVDLEAGGGDIFAYANKLGTQYFYAAWPLPQGVMQRRGLQPCTVAVNDFANLHNILPNFLQVSTIDEQVFFSQLGEQVEKQAATPVKQEIKRKNKLFQKLDQEEKRLHGLLALRQDAEAIQENLWQFKEDECRESVELVRSKDEEGAPARKIALNKFISVKANMLYMFKQSARGARGLKHLEERKKMIMVPDASMSKPAVTGQPQGEPVATLKTEYSISGIIELGGYEEKDVARFMSADGFVLLRGKNAKGNARLQKLGQPHDFWLHAKDGPSAHLIIRRNHVAHEVPEQTFIQAAKLVGEKSWQRHDSKVEVIVAYLRHVRNIKGAPVGTVHVDAIYRTLLVTQITNDVAE